MFALTSLAPASIKNFFSFQCVPRCVTSQQKGGWWGANRGCPGTKWKGITTAGSDREIWKIFFPKILVYGVKFPSLKSASVV